MWLFLLRNMLMTQLFFFLGEEYPGRIGGEWGPFSSVIWVFSLNISRTSLIEISIDEQEMAA